MKTKIVLRSLDGKWSDLLVDTKLYNDHSVARDLLILKIDDQHRFFEFEDFNFDNPPVAIWCEMISHTIVASKENLNWTDEPSIHLT